MFKYNKYIFKKSQIKKPKLRLLISHHAGGSSSNYFNFSNFFPEDWDICFLDLPCRISDFSDTFIKNRFDLQEFIELYLKDFNDAPLALFGHSFGAHISFEIAHLLLSKNENYPLWLGISATLPPHLIKNEVTLPNYLKSNELLIKWMKNIGGTPIEIFDAPELLELFLPVLKNDLTLFHNLSNNPRSLAKLKIPISIFSGKEDQKAPLIEMSNWKNYTDSNFIMNEYEGGHFYFQGKENIIVENIISNLNKLI